MTWPDSPVVLLGAGASAEAGVPTTYGMTQKLVERVVARSGTYSYGTYGSGTYGGATSSALHFVCGALIAYDTAQGKSPYAGLDVERVVAAVELLAERETLEVTPFVAAWHPAVDALDERRTAREPVGFDRKLVRALERQSGFNPAKNLITELIDSRNTRAATGATYRRLATEMLAELKSVIATTSKDVRYLNPLVRHGGTVATLNYDLAVEQAADAAGVALTTGIDQWISGGGFNEWPSLGMRLLKLHGSIDWVWEEADRAEGELPRDVLDIAEDPTGDTRRPALVFGQRGKLTAEGPFLGLLAELEAALQWAPHLIVIGYSFRDDHVNELIRRWAAKDASRTILVVDPAFPDRFARNDRTFRAQLINHLVPLEARPDEFEPRVEVWRMKCSEALTKLSEANFTFQPSRSSVEGGR